MKCSRCGTENRPGRRFCSECGAALAVACPSCGFANEAGEKFCGGCGVSLAAGTPPSPESVTTSPVAAASDSAASKFEIGRAACRGRVEISVVAVSLKKKKRQCL